MSFFETMVLFYLTGIGLLLARIGTELGDIGARLERLSMARAPVNKPRSSEARAITNLVRGDPIDEP